MEITFDSQDVQSIYDHMQDEESRFLFEKRWMHALTGDEKFLWEFMWVFPEMKALRKTIREREDNFLFGAGYYGKMVCHLAPKNWLGILDNDASKWGGEIDSVKIVSPQTILKHPQSRIFLTTRKTGAHYQDEILEQLRQMGIEEGRIWRMDRMIDQFYQARYGKHAVQYFDLPALTHASNETFVDAGCWNGDTSCDFINWSGGRYRRIFAFEADAHQQQVCRTRFDAVGARATVLPYGVWSQRAELRFKSDGTNSHIDSAGDISIPVTSMDQELEGERITFIKMDIEGSELEALRGAEHILREQHPKLAICIYHKPEDIIEIPRFILSCDPTYKLYIRHYTLTSSEMVLYAV